MMYEVLCTFLDRPGPESRCVMLVLDKEKFRSPMQCCEVYGEVFVLFMRSDVELERYNWWENINYGMVLLGEILRLIKQHIKH